MAEAINQIRVIEIQEREARVFPRSDLFDALGQSLILPETRALPAVDLRDLVDGISIQALGLIGYLPLTNKLVLNLRPKFPVSNLWEMLALADENYDRVFPVLRSYQTANAAAPHQLLARGFCHYLLSIFNNGVAKGYCPELYRGYFKPKLSFGRTVARHLSRGDAVTVDSDIFLHSPGIRANAILKSACFDFLRVVPRNSSWQQERTLLLDMLNSLHSVRAERMVSGEQALSNTVPSWGRAAYHGALTVYAVFLGFTRVGFPYAAQGSIMPSFLFRLDKIFEDFIRNSLRQAYREIGISVVNGDIPRNHGRLFRDSRRFVTKPDIILRRNRKGPPSAIAEVKYKPRLEEADRYQVISHVVAANAPIGIWISPAQSADDAGREYVGSITGDAKFYHYKINIASDLKTACAEMAHSIAELIP